ncbi:MAG TPA: SDR family NAD(P)-dependent oxidoreductase, partial [Ilumatobacteraceae bacterium]
MELGSGKVAVVTGAGSGIGLALSEALAGAGCTIVLADVQDDALTAAEDRIGALGVKTLAVRTDVSKVDDVQALAERTIGEFG